MLSIRVEQNPIMFDGVDANLGWQEAHCTINCKQILDCYGTWLAFANLYEMKSEVASFNQCYQTCRILHPGLYLNFLGVYHNV